MVVGTRVKPLCDATKAIQVELSLKGRQLGLVEVPVEKECKCMKLENMIGSASKAPTLA